MLTERDLDEDQELAIDRLYENDETLLIAPTGGGKTVIALTAIQELQRVDALGPVLVIAPLKVCNNVWKTEHLNWSHLSNMCVTVATGQEFTARWVYKEAFSVVVVNFDMVPKIVEMGGLDYFDGLVVDEGSKMARGGVWFKKLRKYIPSFTWRVVMSATPITEGWGRLFYQMFLVDGGRTFGRNRTKWLKRYFFSQDYKGYQWDVIPGQDAVLAEAVESFCHVMPDYKHRLPPFTVRYHDTPLPPAGEKAFREMAGKLVTQGVLAQNAAVKTQKLQQICGGFLYKGDDEVIEIHDSKFQFLGTLFEKLGKRGVANILIVYQYEYELERLRELYPDLVAVDDAPDTLERWNRGEIGKLAIHPRSGSHGLNMAAGGYTLVWLAPMWSLDGFTQQNERLWRRGQTHAVTAHVLVTPDSVESLILLRHASKAEYMPALLGHLATFKQ